MKIVDFGTLRIHINRFNKAVIDLLSVDINAEEDDKTLLLIWSINKSYESLGKTLVQE